MERDIKNEKNGIIAYKTYNKQVKEEKKLTVEE